MLSMLIRTIPAVEREAVSEFLHSLLTGDVDKLPTQTLVHKFWTFFPDEHKQVTGYARCLKKHELTNVQCHDHATAYCGSRFGEKPPERLEQCRQLLAGETDAETAGVPPTSARNFDDYRACFESYRRRVDADCTDTLRRAIVGRQIRATKVVRATMESMRPLLTALPSLRIIHLVRDPRAVALSRVRFGSSGQGAYTLRQSTSPPVDSHLVAEASLYCHHVTADIRSRLALEREFPCRIATMTYEQVVANPGQSFRDIYGLIDEPAPPDTLREMEKKATVGRLQNLSTNWQRDITYSEATTIARRCAEFFRLTNVSAVDI